MLHGSIMLPLMDNGTEDVFLPDYLFKLIGNSKQTGRQKQRLPIEKRASMFTAIVKG